MRAFIEEYGVVILVLAVIFVLIAMVTPLGDMILGGFKGIFANLTEVSGAGNSTAVEETTTSVSQFVQNYMV